MNTQHRLVLLVEDSDDDVLLTQRAFRRANIASPIEVVRNGEAAIAYLGGTGPYTDREKHPLPALVLLDLKLPLKTGFEVLQWIRSRAELRSIPVVVLTSSREGIDVRRAYELGANSYLAKPVAPEATQQMIDALGLYWLVLNQVAHL